jgi:hypothetical protein
MTEFGTRGDPIIPGLSNFQPGFWLTGTPMAQTTEPSGGRIVDVVPGADADPSQIVTAYVSPLGGVTGLGRDTRTQEPGTVRSVPISYSVGGLPPDTTLRLVV